MTVGAVLAAIVTLGGVAAAVTGCMEEDRGDEATGAVEHDVLRLSRLCVERQALLAEAEVEPIAIAGGADSEEGVGGGAVATEAARPAPPVIPAIRVGERLTVNTTVYGCKNDMTGAYACESEVKAGACGYVLNPGDEGPGVTGPSLYVAAGPSWPCGTVFRFVETGQEVIVADRGRKVHDWHLDAYCFNAANRAMCLPGVGGRAVVEVIAVP